MALTPEKLAEKKAAGMEDIRQHWRVENGDLINDGTAGQWNFQESTIIGTTAKVELNGFVILETDIAKVDPATFLYPLKQFTGLNNRKGHFGFNGHNDAVQFRAIRIKRLGGAP